MNLFVHVPGTHLWGIYLQNSSDFREYIFSDFLGIARLFSKVVIPIYTSTSNEQRGPFPYLLVSLEYLIFENCLCCGGRIHFIILIFISFIIREVDHLFEWFSGPLLFFAHWFVETLFVLWILNASLSYFSPRQSLSFNFICSVFYCKICKTSNCLSFSIIDSGSHLLLIKLFPYKIFFHCFFLIFLWFGFLHLNIIPSGMYSGERSMNLSFFFFFQTASQLPTSSIK